jgi:hypothetical protein
MVEAPVEAVVEASPVSAPAQVETTKVGRKRHKKK